MKRSIRTAALDTHDEPKEEVFEFTVLEIINAALAAANIKAKRPVHVEWDVKQMSDDSYRGKGAKIVVPFTKPINRGTTKRRR